MKPQRTVAIQGESGQSIIMITLILVVLIALMALVVDVGNAYAQRRVAQNAADSGALAATQELGRGDATTNHKVRVKAGDYAQLNGIDRARVDAHYFHFDIDTQQQTDLGQVPDNGSVPPIEVGGLIVDGVTVFVDRPFPTFLAGIIGRDAMVASANASGYVSRGACSAGGPGQPLFPVGVNRTLFTPLGNVFTPDYGETYHIWANSSAPGNFEWLAWNQDPSHTSEETLAYNLGPSADSGIWNVGDYIPAGTGHMNSSTAADELQKRIDWPITHTPGYTNPVTVPIYDTVQGTGESVEYHVIGFAQFLITGYNFHSSNKYIEGEFVEGQSGNTEGGCSLFGTKTVKLRPSMTLTRTIEGRVGYQYLQPGITTEQVNPVDVVLVIDTSGSMSAGWGGTSKIDTAKTVAKQFAARLRPDIGDLVGVVRFPMSGETFSKNYKTACPPKTTTNDMYHGEVVLDLTANSQAVTDTVTALTANGGTPIADAMSKALAVVTGPLHVAGHKQVIVLASDGIPNATLDGSWTGYNGSSSTGVSGCNGTAEAQSMDAAQQAKAAGVTVYTVAIGTDFDSSILRAMASPDSDPLQPHFVSAADPTAMQAFYNTLGNRLTTTTSTCTITPIETAASDASLDVYKDGVWYAHTTTSGSGSFSFIGVPAGTYTFAASTTRDGLTYDVFTNHIGGVQMTPQLIVGESPGVYSADLFLKTNGTPVCPGG